MSSTSSRPRLDRALAGRAFAVDAIACAAAAHVLRTLAPSDHTPVSTGSRPSELLLHLSIAAICHQINWDFLSARIGTYFDSPNANPEALSSLTARDITTWLAGYNRPERIRAKERAALLRNVGKVILDGYSGNAELLLLRSEGRLHGPGGFLSRLEEFTAFRADPLRKKSNVLAHNIIRNRIATFSDEDQIAPAIDYHIMRLYLRSGRVVPLHRATLDLLQHESSPRPRLVKLLREAVGEALSLTAMYAGISVPQANEMEWEIGREICERTQPKCTSPTASARISFVADRSGCPYKTFCVAFSNPQWRKLKEPGLKKSFY